MKMAVLAIFGCFRARKTARNSKTAKDRGLKFFLGTPLTQGYLPPYLEVGKKYFQIFEKNVLAEKSIFFKIFLKMDTTIRSPVF